MTAWKHSPVISAAGDKMNLIRSNKGLTLIELLVTLTIISFVLASIYTFYLAGLRGWHRSIDQIEAQQSARIAMDKIIRELRFAHEISLHDQSREIRFKITGDSRTLRFRREGPELIYDSFPTGTSNYMHTKVALGISDLRFSVDHNNLVTVTITAHGETGASTLQSSVRPRNLP